MKIIFKRKSKSKPSYPSYKERKTTQAAAILLKLNGGTMPYMKLVKLLYNIDREAIRRWHRPITFDSYYSMKHGQIVSETFDKAKDRAPLFETYWNEFIETKGYYNVLKQECDDDELSRAEFQLISEIFDNYKEKSQFDMRDEHHTPELFPEYQNPGDSSIHTDYETLLDALGFSKREKKEFLKDLEELAYLESVK